MNFSNHLHSGAERRILLTETVRGENQFQGCHLLSFLATLIEKQTNGWWSDQYCCLQLIPLPRIGAHLPTSALRDREAWVNISAECAASNFLFFFFFSPEEQIEITDRRTFTLEDVFNSSFKPKSYNIRWISGGYPRHSPVGIALPIK